MNFQEEESYICIYSGRDEDSILFYHAGGIDVGNVDAHAELLKIPTVGDEEGASAQNISKDAVKNYKCPRRIWNHALFM